MAGVADIVRMMDQKKRARKTLGIKRAESNTTLQENSTFVKSANLHQGGILQRSVQKVEADEKLYRDVHRRELSSVKHFHSTVHSKSTDVDKISVNGSLTATSFVDTGSQETKRNQNPTSSSRRGSLVLPFPQQAPSSNQKLASTSSSNQKPRVSVQGDSSKYGRSFRKLRAAIAPGPSSRVSPEPVPKAGVKTSATNNDSPVRGVMLVAEARS